MTTLAPNVYQIGARPSQSPSLQYEKSIDRWMVGTSLVRQDASGVALGLAGAGIDRFIESNLVWAIIDLNSYSISINDSPFQPLSAIRFAQIRPYDAQLLLGFDEQRVFSVTAGGRKKYLTPANLLALVAYIIPYTGLPRTGYAFQGDALVSVKGASIEQCMALAAQYFPAPPASPAPAPMAGS